MDFDNDYGSTMLVDRDEESVHMLSSPTATDYVKWKGSQSSCKALDTLIKEVSNNPRRPSRSSKSITPWDSPPSPLPPIASTSLRRVSEPVSRTSTARMHSRSRPARHSESIHTNPANLFNKRDPAQFLDLIKGVSERVDQNAGVRSRFGDNGGVIKGRVRSAMKRKVRGVSLDARDNSEGLKKGVRRSLTLGAEAEMSVKGKEKEEPYQIHQPPGAVSSHHDLSNTLGGPPSTRLADGLDARAIGAIPNCNMMDVDVGEDDKSSVFAPSNFRNLPAHGQIRRTDMPPPPIPPAKYSNQGSSRPGSRIPHQNTTTDSHRQSADQATSSVKLHPLIQQKQEQKYIPPPKPQLNPHILIPPVQAAPPRVQFYPSSQPATASTSRLPPLGMRRAHTLPTPHQSNVVIDVNPQQALPTRQKGFKPPLLSQSQPATQKAMCAPQPQPQAHVARNLVQAPVKAPRQDVKPPRPQIKQEPVPPVLERSSSPDTDDCFGDMSFDMDALEETMRMYD